jgi:tetratricopeptide (TPR) repeat protein
MQDYKIFKRPVPIARALQGVAMLGAFIAAVAFNGTSDPLIVFFMPVTAILAVMLFWPGISKGWQFPKAAAPVFLILFCSYLALNSFWSSVPYMSTFFTFLIFTMPVIALMLVMAQDPKETTRIFAWCFALGWVGLALWSMTQFFILPETKGKRIHGPMLDPNNMAALFNMGLLPAAALFLGSKSGKTQSISAAAATLLFFALVVTQSRAGMVIACVCLILLALFLYSAIRQSWWKLIPYVLVPWLAYKIVNHKSGDVLNHTFGELTYKTSASIVDRHSLWGAGWKMLKEHLWGDIGIGNFYYFYPAYRLPTDMSDGFFVHMDPLQIALEAGIPAAILFYCFLIAVLARTVKALFLLPQEGGARLALVGSFMGMLSIALHSHINYNLYMPGILMPLGLLLAVWILATEEAVGLEGRKILRLPDDGRRILGATGLVLLLAFFGLWPAQAGMTSWMLGQVSTLENAGRHEEAVAMLHRAERFGTPNNFAIYEVLSKLELSDAGKAPEGSEERAVYLRRGLAYIQKARHYNRPFAAFGSTEAQFYFLGRGYVFPDGEEKAEALLRDVIARNPLDIDSRQGLALILQGQGKSKEALEVLEAGLTWPRPKGMADLQFMMSVAKARSQAGDEQGAEAMKNAAIAQAKEFGVPISQ